MPPKKRQCASGDNASDKSKSKAPKPDPDPGPSSSSSSSGSSGSAQTKGQPGEKSEPEYMEGFCCVCTKELREGEGTRVASEPAWLRHAFQGILAGGGEDGGGHQVKEEVEEESGDEDDEDYDEERNDYWFYDRSLDEVDEELRKEEEEERGLRSGIDQKSKESAEDVAAICWGCKCAVRSLQLDSARIDAEYEKATEKATKAAEWKRKVEEKRAKLRSACSAARRILRARGTEEAQAGDVRTVQAVRDEVRLRPRYDGFEWPDIMTLWEFIDYDFECSEKDKDNELKEELKQLLEKGYHKRYERLKQKKQYHDDLKKELKQLRKLGDYSECKRLKKQKQEEDYEEYEDDMKRQSIKASLESYAWKMVPVGDKEKKKKGANGARR